MRIVQVIEFGGPEVPVAGQATDPVAGSGQVVVEVSVADILSIEVRLRSGWGAEYFNLSPPYVPGSGVGGEVISVGEGVDRAWIGRRVVTGTDGGGYAERAVAPVEELIPVPDGIRPVIGQTFPLERATDAYRLSEEGHLRGKIVIMVA